MQDDLIYSFWSADRSPLAERTAQALQVIDRYFPEPTYWKAEHSHRTGPDATFVATTDAPLLKEAGTLTVLWDKSVAHVSSSGIDPSQVVVNSSAYSEDMGIAVRIFFDDLLFSVSTDPGEEKQTLAPNLSRFLDLLRDLGRGPASTGFWLRRHSGFAGDPVGLFEPKEPLAKLYDPLHYDEVIEQVRAIRDTVRAAFRPADFERILRELGAEVEPLVKDRFFAQLGDPWGKGGAKILKQLERRVSSVLKKRG